MFNFICTEQELYKLHVIYHLYKGTNKEIMKPTFNPFIPTKEATFSVCLFSP